MAALWNMVVDVGNGHRGWCPPCQPPNVSLLSVSDGCPVRLAAHPLHIPPRIAMSRLFVLGLLTEMLNLFTAPMRPFIETNPLRRGGPLCPPAHESLTVGSCGDVCLAVNGLPLARWMHPVRAEVAGCYAKYRCLIGLARLGGNASWSCGATIPDGSSLECGCRCWQWPSWTVPALSAAKCELAFSI